jgi:hypothetical protein
VRGYFASFAQSSDRHANFRRAFGESITEFESGMLAHLNVTVGLLVPGAPAESALAIAGASVP